jgi:GT2 family glycosyltransferase
LYEYSKSDYILFLSDDDELFDKTYIEKALNVIKNNSDIVITMSNTKLVYDDLGLEFIENKKLDKIID